MASGAPITELVADRLGLVLTGGRATRGGQGRTYHANLAGVPVVVKWGLDPDLPEKIPYLATQVPELLRRDCPVPRILAHGPLGAAGYAWVLERLAGARATVLEEALLGDLVALIARLAARRPGHTATTWVTGCPPRCSRMPRATGGPPRPWARRWPGSAAGCAPGPAVRRHRRPGTRRPTATCTPT